MTDTSSLRPSIWTPERIKRLKQLWAADFTASEIAETMGAGISRNSVIGKLHRLGGAKRSKQPRRRTPRKPVQRRNMTAAARDALRDVLAVPEPPVAAVEPSQAEPQVGVTIANLRMPISQCRWIDDESSADAVYCGARTRPGSSWCPEHAARVWVPRQRRAA